jgi:hypothetical protein
MQSPACRSAPGPFATLSAALMTRETLNAQIPNRVPLARSGNPRYPEPSCASSVLSGKFITGSDILIDGGWTSQQPEVLEAQVWQPLDECFAGVANEQRPGAPCFGQSRCSERYRARQPMPLRGRITDRHRSMCASNNAGEHSVRRSMDDGDEHGGYVTESHGDVVLTLDAKHNQQAVFVGNRDGGVNVSVWNGANKNDDYVSVQAVPTPLIEIVENGIKRVIGVRP